MKSVAWLRAAPGADRPSFQQWVLRDWAPALLASPHGVAHCRINIALTLAAPPYRPPSDPTGKGATAPDYDVVAELWGDDEAPLLAALAGLGRAVCHAYRVTETVKFDKSLIEAGKPSPGVKLIGLLMFHADMPDSAVRRSWALHAGLAERVHVGAGRYVQNWIDAALSPDAPPARGMPMMHFPTLDDLMQRFADSPRGMQDVIQDTSHFVAGGTRVYAEEWVLR